MDLIATLQVMLRRWYVVVPALLLTGIAVLLVYVAIRPTYQAGGSLILRTAVQAQDPKTGARNQYADYGNLSIPARVITEALSQPTYQERLRKAGVPGTYTAVLDTASVAPIIVVTGEAETPADAIRTTTAVMKEASNELYRRQVNLGAPRVTFLTTEAVATPTEAQPRNGSRLRAAAGVLVLGMIVTLALGFATEALARRRTRGAAAAGDAAGPAGQTGEAAREAEATEAAPMGAATIAAVAGAATGGAGGDVDGRAEGLADGTADGRAEGRVDGGAAAAFECGLCGLVLPATEIVDHLTETHHLGSHIRDFDALFARDRDTPGLDETESNQTRRLRSAGS